VTVTTDGSHNIAYVNSSITDFSVLIDRLEILPGWQWTQLIEILYLQ